METFKAGFQALGGDCEITLAAADSSQATIAIEAAFGEIRRIENKYSRYRADSLLSQINVGAGSGEWFRCDPETINLLAIADRLHGSSDGLFDITSGILRRVWDFRTTQLPDDTELAGLLACIGWPLVERTADAIRLPLPGMEIDFGGFGKEYAADQATAILSGLGIRHGMVNLGGDVRVLGPQPDGSPWLVGIRHPRQPGKILASIPLSRGALATSGDYERYMEVAGKRYCHILHPRTGYPVSHWQSISVFGPDALTAGSYSTIAMLKGAAGVDFLKKTGLKFLVIDQQQQILTN